jgi:hypothetical protein
MVAAVRARDEAAFAGLFSDDFGHVDHRTGREYGVAGALATLRMTLEWRDLRFAQEPIATLGDRLALCRTQQSGSGVARGAMDVGPLDIEALTLVEVDARGRRCRAEGFQADKLGDAVARLYERHAELLPEGPGRTRAAATARSASALFGPIDLDRFAAVVAPDVHFADHRTLGLASARGAEALLGVLASLLESAPDATNRIDDIIALGDDAFLVRITNFGTSGLGGGAYERPFLIIWAFGADGLVTHSEQLDLYREEDALARFDELAAPDPQPKAVRRVRPNAATAHAAGVAAAIAAGDADILPTLVADGVEVVDHTTGAILDRDGVLFSYRSLLKARDPRFRHEPLATLGDSLALCRQSVSASGYTGGTLEAGPFEREQVILIEAEAPARARRTEEFAPDRLGDAVARLYERYAELLPEGPERTRAALRARVTAAMRLLPGQLEPFAAVLSADVEAVDHRVLGTWAAHGPEAILAHWRSLREVADNVVMRMDDVLALRPDASLVRMTYVGTVRSSGGLFERALLALTAIGADGLLARLEMFDPGQEAQALARFDALVLSPVEGLVTAAAPVRFENAATRRNDRLRAAWAARDWEAIAVMFAAGFRVIDRRSYAHVELDLDEHLESLHVRFAMHSSRMTSEVLATRGDRFALMRQHFELADGDVGPSETDALCIAEVDDHGDAVALLAFDPDDLDAAYAELDARWQAGEAAAYPLAAAYIPALPQRIAARDWDGVAALYAPDLVAHDHRLVGWGTLHGPAAFVESMRRMVELSPDVRVRTDHVRVSAHGHLVQRTWLGTRDGGAFESAFVAVAELGTDGKIRRVDFYDPDKLDAAWARFAEIDPSPAASGAVTGVAGAPRIENAATRAFERAFDALNLQDWESFAALFAPGFRGIDRRAMLRNELDRDEWLASYRPIVEMTSPRSTKEVLATRGDRLLLARYRWEGTDDLVGPSEIEYLLLIEVDGRGEHILVIMFDPDALDAAHAELDDRYAAGEAAPYARTWEKWTQHTRAIAARDWEQLASVFVPDLVIEDHRPIGVLAVRSRDEYVASVRALVDLRPDARMRVWHVLALDERRALTVVRWEGDEAEGPFDIHAVVVTEYGPDRLRRREDLYSLDQLDAARARFEDLGAMTTG